MIAITSENLEYSGHIMPHQESLVMVRNIKHRKVTRRLARCSIPWRSRSLVFLFLVIMNTAGALPDIIKIGKKLFDHLFNFHDFNHGREP
jgi:hypothetical protein